MKKVRKKYNWNKIDLNLKIFVSYIYNMDKTKTYIAKCVCGKTFKYQTSLDKHLRNKKCYLATQKEINDLKDENKSLKDINTMK